MHTRTPERVLLQGLAFAEAPRWHDGRLWFSDFYTGQVARVDTDGRCETLFEVPGRPSGLGWLPDGRLLVVSMSDRRLLRADGKVLVEAANLAALAPFDCNDMLVDRHGRAYIGNFGFDLLARGAPAPTVLLMVTPDGAARVVADELLFPNGCVISTDGRTLVVAETFGKRLTAFTVADDGTLSDRRIWADLGNASPDGICLDAEGAIWVASPPTGEFLRVHEGGAVSERIVVDNQAIACALGGGDGHTLFMITGRLARAPRALAERRGQIETARVATPAA